jgi:hypothetical protein
VGKGRTRVNTVPVVRVHHEDQALRILVVVPPQRPDLRTSRAHTYVHMRTSGRGQMIAQLF